MTESLPENCNICPIVNQPSPQELSLRLIEGEHWVATLREDQQFLGTAFVTLREHKPSLEYLTPDEDREFVEIRNRLIVAQKTSFGAKVVNISCLMNEAFRHEPPAPHVHYHFKPRYHDSVVIKGFEDTEFGSYIRRKEPNIPKPSTLQLIRQVLLHNLEA